MACMYPTVAFKLRNATGNTVPPIDDAKDMIPNAVDRLLLNQWAMILVIGPYMMPHETYERQRLDAGSYWRRVVKHGHQRRNLDRAGNANIRGIPQSGVCTGQDSQTQ